MSRQKIAPRLRSMFITGPRHALCLSPVDIEAAEREVRALLALERAVRRWRCAHPGGLSDDEERVVTAHERLSRLSGPRRKG